MALTAAPALSALEYVFSSRLWVVFCCSYELHTSVHTQRYLQSTGMARAGDSSSVSCHLLHFLFLAILVLCFHSFLSCWVWFPPGWLFLAGGGLFLGSATYQRHSSEHGEVTCVFWGYKFSSSFFRSQQTKTKECWRAEGHPEHNMILIKYFHVFPFFYFILDRFALNYQPILSILSLYSLCKPSLTLSFLPAFISATAAYLGQSYVESYCKKERLKLVFSLISVRFSQVLAQFWWQTPLAFHTVLATE